MEIMIDEKKTLHLTDMEIDAIGKIGNISMSSAATVLHDILQRKVTITTPMVSITSIKELENTYATPYVMVEVSYTEGIIGKNYLMIKPEDVKQITSIMMKDQSVDNDGEVGELEVNAIGELMNQMLGTSSATMSKIMNTTINIEQPRVSIVNISENKSRLKITDDNVIVVTYKLEIAESLNTEFVMIMPYDFGKVLVNSFFDKNGITKGDKGKVETCINENSKKPGEQVRHSIKRAEFQSFDEKESQVNQNDNINMLMDVPLMLSVELARTKRRLKDILELDLGSIVSLDKPAGELVEVLINGRLIARGEVVVIDDNFGVRITDIVGKDKRLKGTF